MAFVPLAPIEQRVAVRGRRATTSSAILPPAPARLSTTTCWLKISDSFCAVMRADDVHRATRRVGNDERTGRGRVAARPGGNRRKRGPGAIAATLRSISVGFHTRSSR